MENHISKSLRICFLSEYAYSLIASLDDRVGGAELQMTLIAKEFVKRKYDVSLITFQKASKSPEIVNNIKVYNPFNNKKSGYSYLNPYNIYKLLKLLENIDPDIFIMRGKTPLISIISFYSKLKNKSSIYMLSSDRNASTDLSIRKIMDINKIFYRFGVKNCSYITCQTYHQKELLKKTIYKTGIVIKNLFQINEKQHNSYNNNKLKVIWVGRILKPKQPELFLQLAKMIPEYRFWMIAGLADNEDIYYKEIKKKASQIDNLEFIGFVPHNEIFRYYEKSSLLINTSANEGFPNTYLEAWGNGIPVVSIGFDPDEIICKHKLGFHSTTFYDLVKDTRLLLDDEILRKSMGNNAKNYVLKEHNINNIMDEFERLIYEIKLRKQD